MSLLHSMHSCRKNKIKSLEAAVNFNQEPLDPICVRVASPCQINQVVSRFSLLQYKYQREEQTSIRARVLFNLPPKKFISR